MYVETELYPYQVIMTDERHVEITEMYKWCKEQWGSPITGNPNWKLTDVLSSNVYDSGSNKAFKFSNEEDRTCFLLRWSGL